MIRFKQYIRENLSLQIREVKQPSQSVRETSETDQSLGYVLRESASANNSNGGGRNNDGGSTGGEKCVYWKLLLTRKRKHSTPPYVLNGIKTEKWPRVVLRKLDLNSFKYARTISDTCVSFIHRPGSNKAVRSSKKQKTQPIASISQDRNFMTLRSSTIKKECQGEDLRKASTSLPSAKPEVNDQKVTETSPVKRPRGRPCRKQVSPVRALNEEKKVPRKRHGSPIIAPNERKRARAPNEGKKKPDKSKSSPIAASVEKKKRPVRRRGKRSSKKKLTETAKHNPNETVQSTVPPTSPSPDVDEYYKYNKKRRALSKSDGNNSQNFTRQTRSSKTDTNTDLAKDDGRSNLSGTTIESEGSFGSITDDDVKTQELERLQSELIIEDNESHKLHVEDNNMNTGEHVQTDPDPICQFPDTVKVEESFEIDEENNVKDEESQEPSLEDYTAGDEDSRSVICLGDEESLDNRTTIRNESTDEDPPSESSFKDEERHELNVDDNANNEFYKDEETTSIIYIDDEESLDNRTTIRDESTDEDPLSESSFKDEESREHSSRSDNANRGDDVQTDERRQTTIKIEKSSEQETKNDSVSTEDEGDDDNKSVIYIEDEENTERDNEPENQNDPEDDRVSESQNKQKNRKQINRKPGSGPIGFVNTPSDESGRKIVVINLEEEEEEITWETNLPVKEDDDDSNPTSEQVVTSQADSNTVRENVPDEARVESRESQSRSPCLDDPEPESDSELESEAGFASEEENQNDPEEPYDSDREDLSEAEQMEAEVAKLGQIVAMKVRGQQLTSSHPDPDSTTTTPDAAAPKPHRQRQQRERQNWRAGPLKAQIHNSKVFFECCVEDCPFTTRLYYLFESHVRTSHRETVWTGECDVCTNQITMSQPFSLLVALKHLLRHIKESISNAYSGSLGNGDKNVDKPAANKADATKPLKKRKIDEPGRFSSNSGVSTATNINNSEAREDIVSTNVEEEEDSSYSSEGSQNGDENSNPRAEDVPAVIPEVQDRDINSNQIGSVTKTQVQESQINVVQTPVWNTFNSPPVLAPGIPIEVHTPMWDGFSPPHILPPAVPYEIHPSVWESFGSHPVITFFVPSGTPVIGGFNSPFVIDSSQPLEARTPFGGDFNSVYIPTASIQPSAQIPAVSGISPPFVFEASQSSATMRDSTTSVPAISASSDSPTPAITNTHSVDRASQTTEFQIPARRNSDSGPTPNTSDPSRSQSPATGFPNSPVFVESSQLSGSQSPVRNKTSDVSIPTASNPPHSPTQTPVGDCTNSDLIPPASIPGPDRTNSDVFFEISYPSELQTPNLDRQPSTVFPSTSTQSKRGSVRSTPSYSLAVILDKSSDQQFTLPPQKQERLKRKMHTKGHIISEGGVRPNPKSLEAIRNFSIPSNYEEVRDFLRLVRYCRRFVKGFVEISNPLIILSKQEDEPFIWNEAEQKSFSELKRIFVTEPILHFPDFNDGFILTTESCYFALSCVLSQGEIENGRVVAYGSRKLAYNEEKFSATEKELLAIVWGVKYFEPYLKNYNFLIVTSHEPLTWLITCEDLGKRMAKFRQQLLKYHFKLIYYDKKRPSGPSGASQTVSQYNTTRALEPFEKFVKFHYMGLSLPKPETVITNQTSHTPFVLFYSKDLSNYNPLSYYIRNQFNFREVKEPDNLYDVVELKNPKQTMYLCICRHFHFEKLRYQDIAYSLSGLRNLLETKDYSGKIYIHDVTRKYKDISKDMFSEIVAYAFRDSKMKAVLLQLKKISPTAEERRKVLADHHRTKQNEHYGFRKTYSRIRERYRWKSMKSDIFNYIRHCRTCQDKDTDSELIKFSKSAFKNLNVSIIGPLPHSENGSTYILTVQDLRTKYSYSVALPDAGYQTVCTEFRKFINVHESPKIVSSELGTEFVNLLIRGATQNMDVGRLKSTRLTRQDKLFSLTLRYRLMMFVSRYKYNNWDVVLPLVVFMLNFRYQGSAAYLLFEKILKLVNGRAITN